MVEDKTQTPGISFATEVLEKIIGHAASEVDGIVSMSGGVVEGITSRLGIKSLTKGVSVALGDEQEVTVTLKVIVEYGKNIPTIYQQVIDQVKDAIESTTGLHVTSVSMFVEDIMFPGETGAVDKKQGKDAAIN